MAMRRTPLLPGADRNPLRGALVRPLLLLLVMSLVPACQNDDDKLLRPGSVAGNVVTAFYIPTSEFSGHEILMDGEAKDKEWGGPLDLDRPYAQVHVTSANGTGDPGEPIYVAMKVVYTDTDIFFLFRWVDRVPNMIKDALCYVGPNLTDSTGRQDVLVAESSWARETPLFAREDEDRLSLAFEMEPTDDALGTFREQGCRVACHLNQSPSFGRPAHGRLDVWQWLACRTNQVRDKYTENDNGNYPAFGIPGYLDDFSADPVGGLVPDPGRSCWFPNTFPGSNRPRWIYRPGDDPFYKPSNPNNCFSRFGEDCRVNNGISLYYIWRDDVERIPAEFSAVDTTNWATLPAGKPEHKWRPGESGATLTLPDRVSAFYFTYPSESRADVRGKAVFDAKIGLWTLEVARPLRTGDGFNDVQFTGEPGSEVVFTAAIADNSARRHWGSGPQVLRFGSKTRGPTAASGNGDGR
jgi:hypothetical protein